MKRLEFMDNVAKVKKFLKEHKMYYGDIDLKQETDIFINEMTEGLNGLSSSLKMIPTFISIDHITVCNKKVIVMDAGGTNFRVALVHFDGDGKPVIDYLKKYPMPGTKGEITKEEFFDQIVEYLKPIINESNQIGFCFSFPTEILPNRDGKLIAFNKEVKVTGLEGEKIGENLLKKLKQKGYDSDKRIVLINDTVATLLGGKAESGNKRFDSYVGFILGTGTNSCYIEKNANITKLKDAVSLPGTQIVNIESGGYGRIPRSDIDDIFDGRTEWPQTQLFEKMVSGAYQGGLLLTIFKQAAQEGIFSKKVGSSIANIPYLSSKEIDDFIENPLGNNILAKTALNGNDRMIILNIIDAFFERVACFVSINLAAIILKTGKGRNLNSPVCISAEGTTFYKSVLFKAKLDKYVEQFLNKQLGLYCEFVKQENATILGSAVAGVIG